MAEVKSMYLGHFGPWLLLAWQYIIKKKNTEGCSDVQDPPDSTKEQKCAQDVCLYLHLCNIILCNTYEMLCQ